MTTTEPEIVFQSWDPPVAPYYLHVQIEDPVEGWVYLTYVMYDAIPGLRDLQTMGWDFTDPATIDLDDGEASREFAIAIARYIATETGNRVRIIREQGSL